VLAGEVAFVVQEFAGPEARSDAGWRPSRLCPASE
jgi:hypothetical protein